MDEVYAALTSLRAPLQQGEYDLHRLVMDALSAAGIPCAHEAALAPRCRIDLLCGRVGVEIKRGKPVRSRLISQLTRYAASGRLDGLIVVAERSVSLPRALCGVPVRVLCLNRLWGIAL
jgi:hypothetical protein